MVFKIASLSKINSCRKLLLIIHKTSSSKIDFYFMRWKHFKRDIGSKMNELMLYDVKIYCSHWDFACILSLPKWLKVLSWILNQAEVSGSPFHSSSADEARSQPWILNRGLDPEPLNLNEEKYKWNNSKNYDTPLKLRLALPWP